MTHLFIRGLVLCILMLHGAPVLAESYDRLLRRAAAAKELALDQPAGQSWYSVCELFLAVDGLESSAATQYELAVAASHLDAEDLAADHFALALKMGLDDPARSRATAYLQRLHGRLGRVTIIAEPGLRVYARGFLRAIAPTSNTLRLPVGATTLEFVPPEGGPATTITVQLGPDEDQRVQVPAIDEAAHSSPAKEVRPPQTVPRQPRLGASEAPLAPAQLRKTEPRGTHPSPRKTGSRWIESSSQGTDPPTREGPGKLPLAGLLMGPGVGLLISSGVAVAISALKVDGYRNQLAAVCSEPLLDNRDGCAHAMEGRYDAARGLAREIAQWKTIRAVSWAGVGAGAATTALGLWFLLLQEGHAPRALSWSASVDLGMEAIAVDLVKPF